MDYGLFRQIIDQLPEGTEVDFHKDGEPLMHHLIMEMISYAKKKKMFTHLVTNGRLLYEKKEELVHSDLDLLTISVTDELPWNEISSFYRYKQKYGHPVTQLKVYTDHFRLPEVDKVIKRQVHNWTDSEKRNSQKPCSKLLEYCAVNWDGSWAICCVDYRRKLSPFNVKDVPIEKGIEFNKMIYKWQEEGVFIPPCTNCQYWEE